MSKRILITTHSFYPENNPRAFRAYELYNELVKRGYVVDIIIGSIKKFVKHQEIREYYDRIINDNTPLKVKNKQHNKTTEKLKLPIRYFIGEKFIITHMDYFIKNINLESYTCVISIGTPFYVHMAVAKKLRNSDKKIISICDNGDPFYNYKKKDKAWYFKRVQENTFAAFDYICTPIEEAVDYYSQYVDRSKIRVIPQGFNFDKINIKKYINNDVPTFAFAGRFYEDIRNPSSFLKYLTTLDFKFKFVVYTSIESNVFNNILLKYTEILGEKLVIHPFIPREECIYELSGMDFLINLENTLSVQSPSKLIDYALTKRPILSFNQNNIPKDVFLQFIKGNYEKQVTINLDKYNIQTVGQQFINLIEG